MKKFYKIEVTQEDIDCSGGNGGNCPIATAINRIFDLIPAVDRSYEGEAELSIREGIWVGMNNIYSSEERNELSRENYIKLPQEAKDFIRLYDKRIAQNFTKNFTDKIEKVEPISFNIDRDPRELLTKTEG